MNHTDSGKVWLITGASSGFGRAIAEEALRRGDRVVATARSVSGLADLVALDPKRIAAVALDVTVPGDARRTVETVLSRFGRLDVVVNNAGYGVVGAVEETSEAELRAVMETMFFGAAGLTREAVPLFREQRAGTFVQISSMGGLLSPPGFSAYCAAKHALEAFSESLSAELAPFGVRVLIVEPGNFRTRLLGGSLRSMPPLDAYAPTVGPTRDFVSRWDGTQPGDPAKAARAIVDAVSADSAPLRLPLGGDAVDGIRRELSAIAADVDRSEAVARATTF
ncbi:MAG TPA: oxidoreductase [Polyangiaceae bacterium]|nr:oxidoreductase [Polyangiaceae bacterium]